MSQCKIKCSCCLTPLVCICEKACVLWAPKLLHFIVWEPYWASSQSQRNRERVTEREREKWQVRDGEKETRERERKGQSGD